MQIKLTNGVLEAIDSVAMADLFNGTAPANIQQIFAEDNDSKYAELTNEDVNYLHERITAYLAEGNDRASRRNVAPLLRALD